MEMIGIGLAAILFVISGVLSAIGNYIYQLVTYGWKKASVESAAMFGVGFGLVVLIIILIVLCFYVVWLIGTGGLCG